MVHQIIVQDDISHHVPHILKNTRNQRKEAYHGEDYASSLRKLSIDTESSLFRSPSSTDSFFQESFESSLIEWDELHGIEYLTSGGSSIISIASYKNEKVVVKTLKSELEYDQVFVDAFENEFRILSMINHPNIVKYIGTGFYGDGKRFIVMERLHGGTLSKSLKSCKSKKKPWRKNKNKLSMKDLLKYARDLANALDFCHTAIKDCVIIHRDLKPENIGFTADGQIKLLDFGLARIVRDASSSSNETYKMTGMTGSLRYMAPEVAKYQNYNHKVDIYSFGILLWELLSCKKPFADYDLQDFREFVMHGGERPGMDEKWPVDVQDMIHNCWSPDIEKRPEFSKLVCILDSLDVDDDDEVMASRRSSLSSLFGSKLKRDECNKSKAARRRSISFF